MPTQMVFSEACFRLSKLNDLCDIRFYSAYHLVAMVLMEW